MSRTQITNLIAVISVVVLITLIGMVTLMASRLVNDTVDEQFRSQELQLITALAQQAESAANLLVADITGLALQPGIKSSAVRDHEEGLALMAQQAESRAGVIRAIVRYNFQGYFRYAWPPEVDAAVRAGDDLPFQLPLRLVQQTETGGEVPLDVELIQAPRRGDPGGTWLLIAPVYTALRRTEFLVFEVDLTTLFAQVMGFVALGSRDQLWVVSSADDVLYQATDNIPYSSLADSLPLATLFSYRAPALGEYRFGGADRLAAVAPIGSRGQHFVVILSRDTRPAQAAVEADLRAMFALAAGAIVLMASVIGALVRRSAREARRRRLETQRRLTVRTLLEVSRALNSTLDLKSVLRSIMAELSNIVPYDSAAVLLLDRSRLTIAAHRGVDMADHQLADLDLDKAQAAGWVIRTGRPLVIHNTLEDARWKPLAADSAIRSWIGIPLRVRDKTVGVLNINSHEVGHFSTDEIELAKAFADQASVALQNARLHEMEVKQIEYELTIARDIQTSLLPSAPPAIPQLRIAAYTAPARHVSGDYYQYFTLPDGRFGIAVGDVSGKGIPAALLVAVITTAMRDEISRTASPADLLAALNRRLLERARTMHVSSALLIGVFDPRTRHLEVANGGMVQPYVRSGESWITIPVGGFPLGISSGASYSARVVTLAPGALALVMSDGVVEAQNAAGEIFGFERLEKLLNELPRTLDAQGVIDRVLAAMRAHVGGEEPQDDLTILALHSLEVAAPEITVPAVDVTAPPAAASQAGVSETAVPAPQAAAPEAAASQAVVSETAVPAPDVAASQAPPGESEGGNPMARAAGALPESRAPDSAPRPGE